MFYVVQKPRGISSNLVATILKRILGVDKMGFAGTLDPLATGMMIIGTNGSSRLFPLMEKRSKTYVATIQLDGTTDSYDLEQPVKNIDIDPHIIETLTLQKIQNVIETHFIGTIDQLPPSYSAVWINGQRAYDLVRKGHDIPMQSRTRTIEKCCVLSYTWPSLVLETTVSHGTYIRSLARDLGNQLGTGGYLTSLCRTSIGHIRLANISKWEIHNDIQYSPITHSDVFPDIPLIEKMTDAEKIHLRLGSTPLSTSLSDGYYFVNYGVNYGLLQAINGFLHPIKNCV